MPDSENSNKRCILSSPKESLRKKKSKKTAPELILIEEDFGEASISSKSWNQLRTDNSASQQ